MVMRYLVYFAFLMIVAGCGEQPSGSAGTDRLRPSDAEIAYARSARPEDETIARLYARSCANCHGIAGVNAPLTGHVADWDVRLAERGRDGLLQSTKVGYRAMPARGLCGGCFDDEFLALIDFMMAPPASG